MLSNSGPACQVLRCSFRNTPGCTLKAAMSSCRGQACTERLRSLKSYRACARGAARQTGAASRGPRDCQVPGLRAQAAQALRDLRVVRDPVEAQAWPGQGHDVQPARAGVSSGGLWASECQGRSLRGLAWGCPCPAPAGRPRRHRACRPRPPAPPAALPQLGPGRWRPVQPQSWPAARLTKGRERFWGQGLSLQVDCAACSSPDRSWPRPCHPCRSAVHRPVPWVEQGAHVPSLCRAPKHAEQPVDLPFSLSPGIRRSAEQVQAEMALPVAMAPSLARPGARPRPPGACPVPGRPP